MHLKFQNTSRLRFAVLAAWLGMAATASEALAAEPASPLRQAFDAAWSRQPEALALPSRLDAAAAQRRAAQRWTPDAPALELSNKTDRLTGNLGSRELAMGVAVPLWLPDERGRATALADAQGSAIDSRTQAARLRLAATVREAWWNWQRAMVDSETAGDQLANAERIAADVARRLKAGELARADQHQADGAVAAAQSAMAQTQAALTATAQQINALTGAAPSLASKTAATQTEPPPEATTTSTPIHAALADLRDRADVLERAAALAATQSRAHPELTLAAARDRGAFGERYGHTITLAVRIPLGNGPQHQAKLATARAEVVEAQAQLAIENDRLAAERESSRARTDAMAAQLAATERRAQLAREARGFFDKSFRLGETDLPTRLRIEADANDAERQAARSRIELAAAMSAWRQALGLLPQ